MPEAPDTTPLPIRTPPSASDAPTPGLKGQVLDPEELFETVRKPHTDLTVDSEPDHERDRLNRQQFIPYDPAIHAVTKKPGVELDPATWDDLRSLPAPPTAALSRGSGLTVFVCIQHPQMIVMDGERVVGRFVDGYLATDDANVIAVLTRPCQRYIKRLDLGRLAG